MDEPSDKVILSEAQIPSFLNTLRQAVHQQVIVQHMTVAEMIAMVNGAGLVFIALERTLAGAAKGPSPDEGLPGDGQQQRPE